MYAFAGFLLIDTLTVCSVNGITNSEVSLIVFVLSKSFALILVLTCNATVTSAFDDNKYDVLNDATNLLYSL